MHKRTALPILIACAAWACGSSDEGSGVPQFSGTLPGTATSPVAGQNASNPASPGTSSGASTSGVQGAQGVQGGGSEAQGNPALAAAAPSGATNGASVAAAP
ncbi:MAG TPA: hypothetical protein VG963_00365, partial [Polyangiaceae bacterium]|nr:hypothetical protein [Polyangiaceae bacterium]